MNYTSKSEKEILEWLKNNLNEERYNHSIGVAECAKDLAHKFGEDEGKAYIAGILHDCAKCFSFEKSQELSISMKLDDSEKNNKKTIHAPISSFIAQQEFGVKDKDILSAIRWHTIGYVNMTTFDKIIYIADKIEYRTREDEYANPIRFYLDKSNGLNLAMLQSYKQTIKSLVDRNLTICIQSIDIYNNLLKEISK